MSSKYIETVQDLIDLLNTIKDKSKHLRIQGITGMDENSRNKYIYFYSAEIWGNWTDDDKPILVLQ